MSKVRSRRATHWQKLSADESSPLWLRLAHLAAADAPANGHAAYNSGELARRFGRFDVSRFDHPDGPMIPLAASVISRAIATAVDRGMLEPGSGARCMIVPEVQAGEQGNPGDPCRWCGDVVEIIAA